MHVVVSVDVIMAIVMAMMMRMMNMIPLPQLRTKESRRCSTITGVEMMGAR